MTILCVIDTAVNITSPKTLLKNVATLSNLLLKNVYSQPFTPPEKKGHSLVRVNIHLLHTLWHWTSCCFRDIHLIKTPNVQFCSSKKKPSHTYLGKNNEQQRMVKIYDRLGTSLGRKWETIICLWFNRTMVILLRPSSSSSIGKRRQRRVKEEGKGGGSCVMVKDTFLPN